MKDENGLSHPQGEERPVYERPSLRALSEKEILESFQITQAMTTWWSQ